MRARSDCILLVGSMEMCAGVIGECQLCFIAWAFSVSMPLYMAYTHMAYA
jgi:hypothetical protein